MAVGGIRLQLFLCTLFLQNSVQQAITKQGKLEHTNMHQQKLLHSSEVENNALKQEIVLLRSHSAQKAHADNCDSQSIELVRLKTKIQKQDENICHQQLIIKKSREENNKNLKSLQESSDLLKHYTNSIKSLELDKQQMLGKLDEMQSKLKDLERALEKTIQELDHYQKKCQVMEKEQKMKGISCDAGVQVDSCIDSTEKDIIFCGDLTDTFCNDAMDIHMKQERTSQEPIRDDKEESHCVIKANADVLSIEDVIYISSQSPSNSTADALDVQLKQHASQMPKCDDAVTAIVLDPLVSEALENPQLSDHSEEMILLSNGNIEKEFDNKPNVVLKNSGTEQVQEKETELNPCAESP